MSSRKRTLADLPRRTFLKGLGTAMALPTLDAMIPDAAWAANSTSGAIPVRSAFVFFPNGAIMPSWTPADAGNNYKLTKTLQNLVAYHRSGGGGAGKHPRAGHEAQQVAELQIVGAKVVSPRADAVRFVNRDQGAVQPRQHRV